MRYPRHLIYKEHNVLSDYRQEEIAFIQSFQYILVSRMRNNASWTIDGIINEAFYETTSLLLDFSEQIYFENDYFNEAVKRMPLNIANTVFSVVYLILREVGKLENVQMMIENKLRTRPIFKALKMVKRQNIPLCLYPQSEYFHGSDFVDWKRFTHNFKAENIVRIMQLFPPEKEEEVVVSAKLTQGATPTYVARAIHGQAEAAKILGEINEETFDKVHQLLYGMIRHQLLIWIENDEVPNTGKAEDLPPGFMLDMDAWSSIHDYMQAKDEAEHVNSENSSLKQQLLQAQNEQQKQLRETEEYKATIAEMKRELGKSHIRLDTIADCILRLPTFDMQVDAYKNVTFLLTGTPWSDKAAEVLERMFAKVKNQQDRQQELEENLKKAANKPTAIYQSGSTHDDKRQQMFLDGKTETDKTLIEKKDE